MGRPSARCKRANHPSDATCKGPIPPRDDAKLVNISAFDKISSPALHHLDERCGQCREKICAKHCNTHVIEIDRTFNGPAIIARECSGKKPGRNGRAFVEAAFRLFD
jgi:hypothetical protein